MKGCLVVDANLFPVNLIDPPPPIALDGPPNLDGGGTLAWLSEGVHGVIFVA